MQIKSLCDPAYLLGIVLLILTGFSMWSSLVAAASEFTTPLREALLPTAHAASVPSKKEYVVTLCCALACQCHESIVGYLILTFFLSRFGSS